MKTVILLMASLAMAAATTGGLKNINVKPVLLMDSTGFIN